MEHATDINTHAAETLYRLFVKGTSSHIRMADADPPKYTTFLSPLTLADLRDHVTGKITVGVCANQNNLCRFIGIDFDPDDEEELKKNQTIVINNLSLLGFKPENCFTERHGAGRGHQYLVFDKPVSASIAQQLCEFITQGCEVDKLFAKAKTQIRLPGGYDRIRKISAEFHMPGAAEYNGSTFSDALSALQPIDADKLLEIARRHGWHSTTTLQEIKNSVNIAAVASKLLEKGNYGKFFCPFHNDGEIPNLSIDEKNQRFKCFSSQCGKSGDVIDLVRGLRKCSFQEAVSWLNAEFDLQIDRLEVPQPKPESDAEKQTEKLIQSKRLKKFLKLSGRIVYAYFVRFSRHFADSWFFISIKDLCQQSRVSRNTASHAVDRLRFLGVVVGAPYTAIPENYRSSLPENSCAARYYRVPALSEELLNAAEKQIDQNFKNQSGIRKIMQEHDRALEVEAVQAFGKLHAFITVFDLMNILGRDRRTAFKFASELVESGILEPELCRGERNRHEWRFCAKNDVSYTKSSTLSLSLIPPPCKGLGLTIVHDVQLTPPGLVK
jgi:hypothetical protein